MTTESDVYQYIKSKKGWPDEFCKYYAEKFFNHYQASGWRLSNGNKIKDWQACFNAQWQQVRYKEDLDYLNKCLAGIKPVISSDGEIGKLNELLAKYELRYDSISFDEFGKWYDFLKQNNLLKRFTKEDIELIKAAYNNDQYKCRCAVVKDTFNWYVTNRVYFVK